ncbi:MAG: hypothetical protein JW795_05975 [Chitinivibrionales bacterium]|nr:hypothetical protein [Chitinivibrionales bacterium]
MKLVIILMGALTLLQASGYATTFTTQLKLPHVQVAQFSNHIEFPGHNLDNEPGYPKLPTELYLFLLPPDADLATVSVHIDVLKEKSSTVVSPIEPASQPYSDDAVYAWPQSKTVVDGKVMDVYGKDQLYPQSFSEIITTGMMHCFKVVQVRVYLCQYNPIQRIIRTIEEGTVTVTVSRLENHKSVVYPVPEKMRRIIQKLVINYEDIAAEYATAIRFTRASTYLIMIESAIKTASTKLSDFVKSKEERGFQVKIVTESEWGGGTGQAATTTIRDWLQKNYQSMMIEYVLMIGNPLPTSGMLPMRTDGSGSPGDFFYKELTGTWPNNKEGIAEISLGRIPVYDNSGVANLDRILERTIAYENKPTSEIAAWRSKALFAAKPFDVGKANGSELFEEIKTKFAIPQNWKYYRIYDDDFGSPDEAKCTEAAVAKAWKANSYGLMLWHTHGSETSGVGVMSTSGAKTLGDQYPSFVTMGSCLNAKVENKANLTYTMLINQSVAAIGATRSTWYDNYGGKTWEKSSAIQGFDYMIAEGMIKDSLGIGDALIKGIAKSDKKQWGNICAFNLYGCPQVGIFSVRGATDIYPDHTQQNGLKTTAPLIISSLDGKRGMVVRTVLTRGKYKVVIYAVSGKELLTLAQGTADSEVMHSFYWAGLDKNGHSCGSGAYVIRIQDSSNNRMLKATVIW